MKKEKHECSITLAIGNKCGVTPENKKHIKRYIAERKKQKRDYRVLVIDFNGEYKGTKITVDQIETFKNKVAVIGNPEMSVKEKLHTAKHAVMLFSDGLLIMENAHRYLNKKKPFFEMYGLMACNRTHSVDAVINFPSITSVPTIIMQNTSYIRLHRDVASSFHPTVANKLSNPELYQTAQCIILSQYFKAVKINSPNITRKGGFVILDMENHKIFRCSKLEYLWGVKGLINYHIDNAPNLRKLNLVLKWGVPDYYSDRKQIPISNIKNRYTPTKKLK